MNPLALLFQGPASISAFTSRPLLTAFGMALMGRWAANAGVDVSTHFALGETMLTSVGSAAALPWLLGDTALMIFGLLALFEFLAYTNEDLRFLYEEAIGFVQPGSAFVVNYSFAGWEVSSFIEMVRQLPATVFAFDLPGASIGLLSVSSHHYSLSAAGLAGALSFVAPILSIIWAGILAGATWLLGRVRAAVVDTINTLDDGNSLGLISILHWTETAWVGIATYLIIFLPIIALALCGLTVATLVMIRWYFDRRERLSMIGCQHCGTKIHPTAPACPNCRQSQAQPRQVGLFGQPKDQLATDPAAHRLELIARKRCPVCATRLKERAVRQTCTGCGTVTFADMSAINVYMRSLHARLPRTLLICFLCGLIPVVGVVPGIAYYRLSLVASLKGYVPRTIGCLTRWGIRLAGLVLLALQPIPVLGSLTLPAMCLLNYTVFRKVVESVGASTLGRTFDPIAAPPESAGPAAVLAAPMRLPAPPTPEAPATTVDCPACGRAQAPLNFCIGCGARLGSA
jgi:hypothetical protein